MKVEELAEVKLLDIERKCYLFYSEISQGKVLHSYSTFIQQFIVASKFHIHNLT